MKKLILIGSILGAFFAAPAFAQISDDALVQGAKLCTRNLSHYEREYGIPTHLLSAIATTESGRYHQGLKISVPWPWTINAEGKGYYFDTKEQAVSAARKLLARGVQSMDVGCMQVNLYHHPRAFGSIDKAFDPETNIAYAASFLRELYQSDGTWKKAAADYHSKTPQLGNEYVGIVYNSWYKIVDKLRAARVQTPSSPEEKQVATNYERAQPVMLSSDNNAEPVEQDIPVAASTIAQDTAYVKYVRPVVAEEAAPVAEPAPAKLVAKAAELTPARLPEQEGRKVAAYTSPHMNSIQVTTRKDDGVLVVKPAIKVSDSSFEPSAGPMITVAQAPNTSMVTSVSTRPQEAPHKSGPNFIFND